MRGRILIADDEPLRLASVETQLQDDGLDVAVATDGALALAALEKKPADVVLADLRMPGLDGLTLLDAVRRRWPATDVILITAFASVESAVDAMRRGAHDYLTKPLRYPELRIRLERLLEMRERTRENERLRARLEAEFRYGGLLGRSPAVRAVFERLRAIADSDATVLLVGETGAGKELAARALHDAGPRKDGPFVNLGCGVLASDAIDSELFGHEEGAVPGARKRKRGRLETASGGTLFLDAVDETPLGVQAKLLRVLEEGRLERLGGDETVTVDVRVIAATNEDLEDLVRKGRFRPDLYYQLNVVRIDIPPLRARGDDVLLLAEHFIERLATARERPPKPLAPSALKVLGAHPWPGNVRELAHAIERAFLLSTGPTIEAADLPDSVRAAGGDSTTGNGTRFLIPAELERADLAATLSVVEKELVRWGMAKAAGNQSRAAELLGIPRTTLRDRLERYGLIRGGASGVPRAADGTASP